jgi:ketosteroid isomerase-like protein
MPRGRAIPDAGAALFDAADRILAARGRTAYTVSVMSDDLKALGRPGEVVERLRAAAITQSVEEMRRLYAVDAVHEFPFTRPGVPSRIEGRDAILGFIAAGWDGPLRYERYETLSAYTTNDPDTVVVHQNVHGVSATTGPFVLPNLVVLTAAGTEVKHFRDFVNILAAAEAIGRDL